MILIFSLILFISSGASAEYFPKFSAFIQPVDRGTCQFQSLEGPNPGAGRTFTECHGAAECFWEMYRAQKLGYHAMVIVSLEWIEPDCDYSQVVRDFVGVKGSIFQVSPITCQRYHTPFTCFSIAQCASQLCRLYTSFGVNGWIFEFR